MAPLRGIGIILIFLFIALTHTLSITGTRLLVVLEDLADKSRYSLFWQDLEARGFGLAFESPKSDSLSLFEHGQRRYDQLILLPTKSKGLGPALSPKLLLQFINQDGNILLGLAGDMSVPTSITSLLLELDIHLPSSKTSVVVDHLNYDTLSAAEQHDVILLPAPVSRQFRPAPQSSGLVAFPRPVAQELGSTSQLLMSILRGSQSAYTYDPKEDVEIVEDPFGVGEQVSLVSAMQARNSARFTVWGSTEALEDKWFEAKVQAPGGKSSVSQNRQFAAQVSAWTFHETGVLRVGKVEHHLVSGMKNASSGQDLSQLKREGELNPKIYRIKNDVQFSVELSIYNMDHFEPFEVPSANDAVQLEFSMLSPFHRLDLDAISRTANSNTFTTAFRLPDQHGIFKFSVQYKRPFFTNVDVEREVTVRHFAHDEFARSWEISGGRVWIAGLWATIVGWVAFVAIWLWSKPTEAGHHKTL